MPKIEKRGRENIDGSKLNKESAWKEYEKKDFTKTKLPNMLFIISTWCPMSLPAWRVMLCRRIIPKAFTMLT